MKKIYYIFAILSLFILGGCGDYLDTKPGDKYDDFAFWANPTLAEQYVYKIYEGVPYPYQWYMSGSLVDEQVPIQADAIITNVTQSLLTPDNLGAFDDNWGTCMEGWWWKSAYANIRACNTFFKNVQNMQFPDEAKKQQLISEVHFLRAYMYYLLMAQYGGVPLLTEPVDLGSSYKVPRATFAATIDFIVADLNAVIDNKVTIEQQKDKHRATLGAVYALKSRVLIYAASEMHHNLAWAAGYEHPELIGYVKDDREQLYKDAKTAAEECMKQGYSLYNVNPDKAKNFQELFLQMQSDEQIFITTYDKVNFPYYATDWVAWVCGVPSYGGYALNQVTANLADAFENIDGTSFNFEQQKNTPYTGRDPRFDGSILHNGSSWYANNWGIDYPVTTIDITGPDAKEGVTTGYYMKKFISPKQNNYYYGSRQPQPYMNIRYAEVLLNYAEACLGLHEEGPAREALNKIRVRAGMPSIPDGETGITLWNRYMNERRVELAFEGHRLFDVRRWLIAPSAYVNARGVKYDKNTGAYSEVNFENRSWKDSHYLIPIKRTEIQKNAAMFQNPLYK